MSTVSTRILAAAALGVGLTTSAFAAQTPIIGSGYTADVIADVGDVSSPVSSITAGGVDGQFAYVQQGYTGLTMSGAGTPPSGLPTGTVFASMSDATTTFSLQPAGGSNAIKLTSLEPSATFALTTPAMFSTLSFLATGTNGAHTFTPTVTYTDGTSTTLGTLTAPDNFNVDTNIAIFAKGRVQISNNDLQLADNNPRLYQLDAGAISSTKTLASISFTGTGLAGGGTANAQNAIIFGISGTAVAAVPEPASLGLLGLGGLTLLRRRRA